MHIEICIKEWSAFRMLPEKLFLYVNYIIYMLVFIWCSISISGMMQRFQFGRTVQYRMGIASRTQREQCRAYSTAHCATYRNNVSATHAHLCGPFQARTIKPRFTGRKVNEGGHVCPFSVFQSV